MTHHEIPLIDGRTLRAYDSGSGDIAVLWHHGSPQTGALLQPVLDAARERGIRLLSYARPSYLGSTPQPGRTVSHAASDVRDLLDYLGIERFATVGASGGGPHALACADLLPDRVTAVATLAGIAPHTTAYDWFEGMRDPGGLRAALNGGRDARAEFEVTAEFDPSIFTPDDLAALDGRWATLGADAQAAGNVGPDGLIDDDVAFAKHWGFDPQNIAVPTLVIQGDADRVVPVSHGRWLAERIPGAEYRERRAAGHITVLDAVPEALGWLAGRA